jgi:hypothetical protein
MDSFVINFVYQGVNYVALVTPKIYSGQEGYAVKIESENQELFLDIFAQPCGDDKTDWCFIDSSEPHTYEYEKEFLQEIGEAIEKYQTRQL